MTKDKAVSLKAETPLEQAVAKWLKGKASDYDGDLAGVFKDLFYGGCESGIVGGLIYYKDTLSFYAKHKQEIHKLLAETMESIGINSPANVFGDKWDNSDPLADDTQNQNLLAWFGFEETARKLADNAGIEA